MKNESIPIVNLSNNISKSLAGPQLGLTPKGVKVKFLTTIFILSLAFNVSALEIKDFKSGLVCTDAENFGWICHERKDIYVTGQGRCVWNGETIPCTWYGYEFAYSGNVPGTAIECEYALSQKTNTGNPERITDVNTDKGKYSLSLEDESGHFFNPQYVGFRTQVKERALRSGKTICRVNGSKVFEYEFNIHFPVSE